jgi:hypothetical protein
MWLSLVDENGNQCFSVEQIGNIANLPEYVTVKILTAIRELRERHPSKKND